MKSMIQSLFVIFCFLSSTSILAGSPEGYYLFAEGKSGADLKSTRIILWFF